MPRLAAPLIVIGAMLAAWPAVAQLGTIFNNTPPRPPADVPSAPFPAQPPPVQYPGQYPGPSQPAPQYPVPQQYPAQQYPVQKQYPAPQQSSTASQYQTPAQSPTSRPPSGIQAQPLPPPPGASLAPVNSAPVVSPPSAVSPTTAARSLPTPANPPPPQPADTSPRPDDTVVTETPTQKIENGRAVFSGLDKITGRTISFDAAIGETVQFGALQVTARACYTRPPTEATNTDAFVEVDEVTLQGEIKRVFTGWMFASSPGLHAVEHPIYDVWLTDCSAPLNAGPVAQSTPPPTPTTAAPAPNAARSRQQQPPRQRPAPPPPPVTDD